MAESGSTTEGERRSNTKVARIIDKYGLTGLGADLEASWTGDGVEKKSLRTLATDVNHRILAAVFEEEPTQPVQGELENLYSLLTDDEASVGARIEAEHRLREIEVDVDEIRRDFVSHQAVYTYLTETKGISYESTTPSYEERVADRTQMLRRLRTRLEAVTESTIQELHDSADGVEIISSLSIQCSACGASYSAEAYLRSDGCSCRDDTNA